MPWMDLPRWSVWRSNVEEAPYQAIIIDNVMPDSNGMELMGSLLSLFAGAPPKIVMLSTIGSGTHDNTDKADDGQVAAWLSKPATKRVCINALVMCFSPR